MISFGQNGVKVRILVPAKPHGPENSVAGDLAGPRSGKSRFLSTFGPSNSSRVLATRIFKGTWLVGTVEKDAKAAV